MIGQQVLAFKPTLTTHGQQPPDLHLEGLEGKFGELFFQTSVKISCVFDCTNLLSVLFLRRYDGISLSPTKKPTAKPTANPSTSKPTAQPTKKPTPSPSKFPTKKPVVPICGNGSCQSSETSSTCPQDCSNIILNGISTGSFGNKAVMFMLTAKDRDVTVKSFSFYTWNVMNSEIQVYTRVGDYRTYEFNSTGWEQVYDKPVTYMGRGTLTALGDLNNGGVEITKGTARSFYIVSTNYILYNITTQNEGDLLTQDSALTRLYSE
jgi:hypothetical protein